MFDLLFTKIAYADELGKFLGKVNTEILNPAINLLFAVAFIVFFYGVVEFLSNAPNGSKNETGKKHMLWGIIGLTIMFSVWGILQIVIDTLNSQGINVQGINPKEGTVNLKDYNPNLQKIKTGSPSNSGGTNSTNQAPGPTQ